MFQVLGYFGYKSNKLDGQTIKTRNLFRLASEIYPDCKFYDTEEFQYKKLSIIKMLINVCKAKTLIYLPAHNNLKYIFPIIFILSKIFNTKIHYFVIGGWLCEFIKHKPIHKFMLKHICSIQTETKLMKKLLTDNFRFSNVATFQNFRYFDFCPQRHHDDNKLHLVFMARINKMKGLDMIFELGNYIISQKLYTNIDITFYGQIKKDDESYFKENLQKFDFMKYKGALQPDDIYNTIQKYDVMLLPTHYYTEGLPGTIVDAYISGIPVIVTNWKHANEFVSDGKSGFIVPFENGQKEFNEKVLYLLKNPNILDLMKAKATECSKIYSANSAKKSLTNLLA